MYLFIDETENDKFFIVAGLLVNSKEEVINAYNRFKKSIKQIPIDSRERSILFTEFKATLIDRKYKKVKLKMFEELNKINPIIIYSSYTKNNESFTQANKEKYYLEMLTKIVNSIKDNICIIFDTFNKRDFEKNIKTAIVMHSNVKEINSSDSQLEEGLQFNDNICSIIRLNKTHNDKYNFYKLIERFINEV